MKSFLIALVGVLLMIGCSDKRDDFDSKLKQVKIGMTKNQVERVLGKADDVASPTDHPGTWTAGTSEVWGYGTEAHNAVAKNGAVYFDERGGVQYVYGRGGRIEPRE